MDDSNTALIIFAREPKDGKVKTRLCRDLSPVSVTRIYKAFVKDAAATALKARCDQRLIYYAGTGSSIPFLRSFEGRFRLRRQTGRDLGERMHRAFAYCHKKHFGRIVIIGTDCVTLTAKDIERAFAKLESHDCVLGPCRDGGYYLIGLKFPQAGLFKGINWDTSQVLDQTLRRAGRMKKTVFLLRTREDVDTAADLRKLLRNIKKIRTAAHTQRTLKVSPFKMKPL